MLAGTWGRKIGMTQCFLEEKVIPLTAVDISHWYVIAILSEERDGYNAIRVGLLKDRYRSMQFSADWFKSLKKYFFHVREIRLAASDPSLTVGTMLSVEQVLSVGNIVNVTGITKGAGFAGVIRRHRFNGPPASHGGQRMGKRPGSGGFIRRGGKVIRGKRFPGHMGAVQRVMRNLEVIQLASATHTVFIKGSIPGKARSLVFIEKSA